VVSEGHKTAVEGDPGASDLAECPFLFCPQYWVLPESGLRARSLRSLSYSCHHTHLFAQALWVLSERLAWCPQWDWGAKEGLY
jgi:hypothetical protein